VHVVVDRGRDADDREPAAGERVRTSKGPVSANHDEHVEPLEAIDRLRATVSSHRRAMLVEVMGQQRLSGADGRNRRRRGNRRDSRD
jgi:hypothetical protein